jgi:hypothetical protein
LNLDPFSFVFRLVFNEQKAGVGLCSRGKMNVANDNDVSDDDDEVDALRMSVADAVLAPRERIVDVAFGRAPRPRLLATACVAVASFLLYHRQQLPAPFADVRAAVVAARVAAANERDPRKRLAAQRRIGRRTDTRLVDAVDALATGLDELFARRRRCRRRRGSGGGDGGRLGDGADDAVAEVLFVFGSSVASPREVYSLKFDPVDDGDTDDTDSDVGDEDDVDSDDGGGGRCEAEPTANEIAAVSRRVVRALMAATASLWERTRDLSTTRLHCLARLRGDAVHAAADSRHAGGDDDVAMKGVENNSDVPRLLLLSSGGDDANATLSMSSSLSSSLSRAPQQPVFAPRRAFRAARLVRACAGGGGGGGLGGGSASGVVGGVKSPPVFCVHLAAANGQRRLARVYAPPPPPPLPPPPPQASAAVRTGARIATANQGSSSSSPPMASPLRPLRNRFTALQVREAQVRAATSAPTSTTLSATAITSGGGKRKDGHVDDGDVDADGGGGGGGGRDVTMTTSYALLAVLSPPPMLIDTGRFDEDDENGAPPPPPLVALAPLAPMPASSTMSAVYAAHSTTSSSSIPMQESSPPPLLPLSSFSPSSSSSSLQAMSTSAPLSSPFVWYASRVVINGMRPASRKR